MTISCFASNQAKSIEEYKVYKIFSVILEQTESNVTLFLPSIPYEQNTFCYPSSKTLFPLLSTDHLIPTHPSNFN